MSLFIPESDVFKQPVWDSLSKVDDPEFKELAVFLPSVVLQYRAPSTVKKYIQSLEAMGFTEEWFYSKIPREAITSCSIHLAFLIRKSSTCATVLEAVHAVAWTHQIAGSEDPTQCAIIKKTVVGAKRMLAHRTKKKEPKTTDILKKLVECFAKEEASLYDIRTIAMCLICFANFLRFNEMSRLKESDVQNFEEHAELFIKSSKTDQYRDGAWVVIACTGKPTCPVSMLEHYTSMGGILGSHEIFLFRGIVNTKSGFQLRKSGSISYTRVRELLLENLVKLGLDPKQYGLHSLKASAVANAGVPDRLFKRHGRWLSENAKDGYVKVSLESRLFVAKCSGIYWF